MIPCIDWCLLNQAAMLTFLCWTFIKGGCSSCCHGGYWYCHLWYCEALIRCEFRIYLHMVMQGAFRLFRVMLLLLVVLVTSGMLCSPQPPKPEHTALLDLANPFRIWSVSDPEQPPQVSLFACFNQAVAQLSISLFGFEMMNRTYLVIISPSIKAGQTWCLLPKGWP